MLRRQFLAASATAAVGVAISNRSLLLLAADQPAGADRLTLELRKYHFASAAKQQAYEKFLASAAIPAYNRAGIEPVGAFKLSAKDNPELKLDEDPTDLWVLLPHKSLNSVLNLEKRLASDEAFETAGREILTAPKNDPSFTRYETALLYAFDEFQKVAPPAKAETRVLEMRTYENPNQERALNKMKMFNSGEIPIFQHCGMPGVFFGEAIAGSDLPHLTYMIAHNDAESITKNWNAFRADADWKKLNSEPQYKDNVSKITRLFLRPTSGSQI
jgi:hypothetical protein